MKLVNFHANNSICKNKSLHRDQGQNRGRAG